MLARTPMFSNSPRLFRPHVLALLLATPLLAVGLNHYISGEHITPSSQRIGLASHADTPLFFEPNAGQTAPAVSYTTSSTGGRLFFTAREVVLASDASTGARTVPSRSSADNQP